MGRLFLFFKRRVTGGCGAFFIFLCYTKIQVFPIIFTCYYDAMLARAARLCGLRMSMSMSMSDARHTFAVSCAKRGMNIRTLSRFLGMSLQKTEKVYGTYHPENDVECLDKCLKSLWNE